MTSHKFFVHQSDNRQVTTSVAVLEPSFFGWSREPFQSGGLDSDSGSGSNYFFSFAKQSEKNKKRKWDTLHVTQVNSGPILTLLWGQCHDIFEDFLKLKRFDLGPIWTGKTCFATSSRFREDIRSQSSKIACLRSRWRHGHATFSSDTVVFILINYCYWMCIV